MIRACPDGPAPTSQPSIRMSAPGGQMAAPTRHVLGVDGQRGGGDRRGSDVDLAGRTVRQDVDGGDPAQMVEHPGNLLHGVAVGIEFDHPHIGADARHQLLPVGDPRIDEDDLAGGRCGCFGDGRRFGRMLVVMVRDGAGRHRRDGTIEQAALLQDQLHRSPTLVNWGKKRLEQSPARRQKPANSVLAVQPLVWLRRALFGSVAGSTVKPAASRRRRQFKAEIRKPVIPSRAVSQSGNEPEPLSIGFHDFILNRQ